MILSSDNEQFLHVSVHFPISIKDIQIKLDRGDKYTVDFNESKIRFKRAMSTNKQDTELSVTECTESEMSDANLEIFQKAYEIINLKGREFLAVSKGIADVFLDMHNNALQLLLDIGNLLSEECLTRVRHNKISLDFWATVHTLFNGKANRFFQRPYVC